MFMIHCCGDKPLSIYIHPRAPLNADYSTLIRYFLTLESGNIQLGR